MNFEQLIPFAETKKQQNTVKKFAEKGFKPTKGADWHTLAELVGDFLVAEKKEAVALCVDYVLSLGYPYPDKQHKINHLNWNLMWRFYYLKYYFSDEKMQEQLHNQLVNLVWEQTLENHFEHDAGKHSDEYVKDWAKANYDKWLTNIRDYQKITTIRNRYTAKDNTPKERYEQGISLIYAYLGVLFFRSQTTNNQQELLTELQNHLTEMKSLYKQINKLK
ncbi:hypothetical protein [Capnocytophaga sp.]|uniref:hypothetical protein n=1 Tax=Capnocytophaga sp. TaxID=44737 RepID=UPI0026DD06EF|nr:hypothetical protein [Capnocytophaga sp.]MDO5106152.1 hypothetical protein [Capnocytophaga sp.]